MTNTNTEKLPEAPEFININLEGSTADYAEELAGYLSDEQKEFAADLIDEIKSRNTLYICDFVNEWTDNRVDFSYCDLYKWLADCNESDEYMERAISEYLVDASSGYSFFKHMQAAQYLQISDQVNDDLSYVLRYAVAAVASDSHPYITEDQRDEIESLDACDLDTLDDLRDAIANIFQSEN